MALVLNAELLIFCLPWSLLLLPWTVSFCSSIAVAIAILVVCLSPFVFRTNSSTQEQLTDSQVRLVDARGPGPDEPQHADRCRGRRRVYLEDWCCGLVEDDGRQWQYTKKVNSGDNFVMYCNPWTNFDSPAQGQMVIAVQALGSIRQLSVDWVEPVQSVISLTQAGDVVTCGDPAPREGKGSIWFIEYMHCVVWTPPPLWWGEGGPEA